jgi:hypothetical protein
MMALDKAGMPRDEAFREPAREHVEFGSRVAMSVKPDFCNIPRMLSRSGAVVVELADGAAAVEVLGALVCAIARRGAQQ